MLKIGNTYFVDSCFKKGVIVKNDGHFFVKLYETPSTTGNPSVVIKVNSDNIEDAVDILYNALEYEIRWECDENMYQIVG